MSNYLHINKEWKVSPNESRHVEVLDDFGITKETVTVSINLKIPRDFDVLYITGESGSGKSTILGELYPESVINDDKFMNTPIIDMGSDYSETIKVLSLLGLGDDSLFTLSPDNLSDSQKYRSKIAYFILRGDTEIILDEFLSTLDRETAKSIAFNIQKSLRRLGIKLIVATAHEDLFEYLKPDVVVRGRSFPSRFEVEEFQKESYRSNPFLSRVCLFQGNKDDYRREPLGEIHYKGKYSGGKQEYFFAKINDDVIGVLVTNNLMSSPTRRIIRVVVHPTYRGVGIAQELIKFSISMTEGDVDVLAAMAKYTPVFEKSGMVRADDVVIIPPKKLENDLEKISFDKSRWSDMRYCLEACDNLEFREVLSKYAKHTNKLIQPGGKSLSESEREEIIRSDSRTAARVLWSFRKRTMAKFEYIKGAID